MAPPKIDDAIPWYAENYNIDVWGKTKYTITLQDQGVVSLQPLDTTSVTQKWEAEYANGWFRFWAVLTAGDTKRWYLAKDPTGHIFATATDSEAVSLIPIQEEGNGYRILANVQGDLNPVVRLDSSLYVSATVVPTMTKYGFTAT
jgi:hypothetical protein